jgi:hypothetical protein
MAGAGKGKEAEELFVQGCCLVTRPLGRNFFREKQLAMEAQNGDRLVQG